MQDVGHHYTRLLAPGNHDITSSRFQYIPGTRMDVPCHYRPKTYTVTLNDDEREQLRPLAYARSLPHAVARRAKIILMAADGMTNTVIAEKIAMMRWRN